jgi:hypothetical protein
VPAFAAGVCCLPAFTDDGAVSAEFDRFAPFPWVIE